MTDPHLDPASALPTPGPDGRPTEGSTASEVLAVDPAARPSRGWTRPSWRSSLSVLIVVLAFGLPLRALFRYQGPPMEEGFMLVFPERVMHGALPNRDFLHLYGPGSLWVLAAWFKAFRVSLAAERAFGLIQLAGITFGVMALVRPWGRRAATAAGLLGVLISTTAIGLTALAWNGAVALGVIALWIGLRARRRVTAEGGDAVRLLLVSGLLAGLALLYRPDMIVAVALGGGALLWGLGWPRLRRWGTGLAVGLAPYVVQLATAGPGHSIQGMILDPVFRLRDWFARSR
ncbi:MAG TPA: hypothetical protein VGM93_12795 [Acidimicrobiales bacterium]